MKRFAVIVALFLSTTALGALPGVTEFRSAPEALTDAELSALLSTRVASADVVAIGETVHGSSALLRMQTRLIRYLVANYGFRLILWENPPQRSLELSRWLSACTRGSSPPPMDVLYMPTPSDLPLFTWLCEFNRAHPQNPVSFRGIDIWDRPWEHFANVKKLAPDVDAGAASTIDKLCPGSRATSWDDMDTVIGRLQSDGRVFPEAEFSQCRAALTRLFDAAHKARAYELGLSASTLLGWLEFYNDNWADDIRSWNARDLAQGRNIMLAMEQHGAARAIVSAHTSHVSHNRSRADWWGFGDIKSGIHFFQKLTGKRVFNIALTAYEASGAQGPFSVPVARNSLDKRLHDAGHAFAFFHSNAPFLSEHPRWWMQNQNYPGPYESGVEIVPADHFDAFFFFDRSHLDRALPARPMWQP